MPGRVLCLLLRSASETILHPGQILTPMLLEGAGTGSRPRVGDRLGLNQAPPPIEQGTRIAPAPPLLRKFGG